jgi:thiamine pyrophosphate-dependent acetolactate synthase large subunit-like protein
MTIQTKGKQTAGQLLVRSLVNQDVKFIFGIPGGKIMPTFDVLNDEGPKIIVCRHEQNAADVQGAATQATPPPLCPIPRLGAALADVIVKAAKKIAEAQRPVILLGLGASEPKANATSTTTTSRRLSCAAAARTH